MSQDITPPLLYETSPSTLNTAIQKVSAYWGEGGELLWTHTPLHSLQLHPLASAPAAFSRQTGRVTQHSQTRFPRGARRHFAALPPCRAWRRAAAATAWGGAGTDRRLRGEGGGSAKKMHLTSLPLGRNRTRNGPRLSRALVLGHS